MILSPSYINQLAVGNQILVLGQGVALCSNFSDPGNRVKALNARGRTEPNFQLALQERQHAKDVDRLWKGLGLQEEDKLDWELYSNLTFDKSENEVKLQ